LLFTFFIRILDFIPVAPLLVTVDHDDDFTGKYFSDMSVGQFSAHVALLIFHSANFLIRLVLLNELLYKV